MTKLDQITYEVTRNSIQCIGWDVSADEDGRLFQVDCTCDTCKSKYILEEINAQQLGRTWRDFTSKQVERFKTGDLS